MYGQHMAVPTAMDAHGGSGYSGESMLKNPVESAPPTAVPMYLGDLEQQLQGAHKRLAELAQRLGPALRPLPPNGGVVGNEKMMGSPLAEAIRAQSLLAEGLVRRINELIDAVDL